MDKFLAELLRLVAMTGNCGRVISRFIERHFTLAGDSAVFKYPVQVKSPGRLNLALAMSFLDWDLRTSAVIDHNRLQRIKVSIDADLLNQQVVFSFDCGTLPLGVKERQAMLKYLEEVIQWSPVNSWVLDRADGRELEIVMLGGLAFKKDDLGFSIFEDLVSGDFSRIHQCAQPLVRLATFLNRDVLGACSSAAPLMLEPLSCDEVDDLVESMGKNARQPATRLAAQDAAVLA